MSQDMSNQTPTPKPVPAPAPAPTIWERLQPLSFAQWGIVAGVLAVVLACCFCSGFLVRGGGAGTPASHGSATATTAPAPTHTPKPKATVTPKVTQKELETVWAQVIQPDVNTMQADLTATGNACSSDNLTTCGNTSQQLADDSAQFIQLLESLHAPACIQAPAAQILAAAKDFHTGAELAVSGIDNNDPSQLNTAAADYTAGSQLINTATAGLLSAHCAN